VLGADSDTGFVIDPRHAPRGYVKKVIKGLGGRETAGGGFSRRLQDASGGSIFAKAKTGSRRGCFEFLKGGHP